MPRVRSRYRPGGLLSQLSSSLLTLRESDLDEDLALANEEGFHVCINPHTGLSAAPATHVSHLAMRLTARCTELKKLRELLDGIVAEAKRARDGFEQMGAYAALPLLRKIKEVEELTNGS